MCLTAGSLPSILGTVSCMSPQHQVFTSDSAEESAEHVEKEWTDKKDPNLDFIHMCNYVS